MANAHVQDYYAVLALIAQKYKKWLAYEGYKTLYNRELAAEHGRPVLVH